MSTYVTTNTGTTPVTQGVKTAGEVTWTGGLATLATTVTGVVVGDIVVASIKGVPTEAAYLASATETTDTITFTLSAANTSNDAVISYVVYSATA